MKTFNRQKSNVFEISEILIFFLFNKWPRQVYYLTLVVLTLIGNSKINFIGCINEFQSEFRFIRLKVLLKCNFQSYSFASSVVSYLCFCNVIKAYLYTDISLQGTEDC